MSVSDRKATLAPHWLALARVFDRLAEQEPNPELRKQRQAEALKMHELSTSQADGRAAMAGKRLS